MRNMIMKLWWCGSESPSKGPLKLPQEWHEQPQEERFRWQCYSEFELWSFHKGEGMSHGTVGRRDRCTKFDPCNQQGQCMAFLGMTVCQWRQQLPQNPSMYQVSLPEQPNCFQERLKDLAEGIQLQRPEQKQKPFICSMLLALGERAAFAATLNPYVSENSRTLCHQILLRWQLEPTIDLIGNNPFQPSEHRNTSHVNGAGDIRKMLITCIAFIRS